MRPHTPIRLRALSVALVPLAAFALSSDTFAAEKPETKAPEKKEPARTKNRGPENPELVFKLPAPKVLTPAEELKTIKVAKGFHVELVASEPLIGTPVAMSWDDQGRIYVCEMIGYMNDIEAKGEDQPIGRITRLEDKDGDGVFETATVFADKLYMPRSVTAFGDGCIVAEPPNLIWYHDTDGDGVADKKEVIAENFGAKGGQPEHMANSLTFLQDNWLWGAGYSQRLRFAKGKFIAEPTRSGGQWGLTQDDWGRRYFNYNSDFLRTDLLPPSVYARNPNLADKLALNWQVMKDQHCFSPVPTPGVNRGYNKGQLREDGGLATCTATCGTAIYRGDLFPKEFRGNAFIPEPAASMIKRVILSETGGVVTGKNAYENTEFLYSADERFRPVNCYNGPDGALYIVDIARGIIQHRAFITHYLEANIKARNLEQPINLGRIWRVVPDKATPKTVKLPKETSEIVAFLDHSSGQVRDTAQRLLVERADASVIDAIKKIVTTGKTPQGRVQALWTLEGLNAIMLSPETISAALKDGNEKVRAAAVRLASVAHVPDMMKMTDDESAEVRVQLALQLSAQPGPEAQKAVLALLKKGGSPLLNDAIASGGRGHELEYLTELLKEPAGKTDQLAKSGLLKMLAGCVMSERRSARVAELLKLTAAQAPESPRQLALVNGIVGIPSDGKGKVQPRKLLYFEAQPEALSTLQSKAKSLSKPQIAMASGEKKSLFQLIDAAIAWPGKPGVPPPPVIVPLNAEQQKRFDDGKVIFAGLCAACHQPSGTGMEGLAPPLVDSDWVLGPAERPIKIILHGVGGPINVGGRTWRLEMPPLPTFSDEQIASVLTYVRREWEHNASPVSPAEVTKVREANKTRTGSWTEDELRPPKPKTSK
jgi:mono/diheme cytochrome c family protein/glucose/arabinose dehydrogenase